MPLRSMTGYGRGEARNAAGHFSLQLKSVNNRFLELALKLPSSMWAHEAEARAMVQAKLSRGKVEATWKELPAEGAGLSVSVDTAKAQAFQVAVKALALALGTKEDLRLADYARLPGVLAGEEREADDATQAAAKWDCLKAALAGALEGMQASREREGGALGRELARLLDNCESLSADIERRSLDLQGSFHEKVAKRLAAWMDKLAPDDPRLAMEAALLVDKADIREELVRFRTHVAEARRLLQSEEPVGKKLDFLGQELLREANTMGSKSPDAGLTSAVVALKSELEKLKEQIQNIE